MRKKITSANKNILCELKTDLPAVTERIPAQIVASGPDDWGRTEIKDAMIRMIMVAKKSVRIQTPYFTPDAAFFSAV